MLRTETPSWLVISRTASIIQATRYGMICISIAQESRRLALADMLNAAAQCDVLECRLDLFGKAPEIGELLANKPKPMIMSCRRTQDGGHWSGSEQDRIALLRQC